MESFDIAREPISVEEREIDVDRQPTEEELARFADGCELLGRYFKKLDVASGRSELTPELEAKYPGG
jgi:hypothetical protein